MQVKVYKCGHQLYKIIAVDTASKPSLSYRDAGVDIDRADRLINSVKSLAAKTHNPAVLGGIGGFGALFELPVDRYRRPVLVSGTDGVGTKLRLAIDSGIHHTVGVDLVAMCVNDILVLGAEPLYFLDYYATARLEVEVAEAVIKGIVQGCELAGCALIGGETAELPGMYAEHDYDLAGFCVGVVEKDKIIDAGGVTAGDVLIGLASSGPHSNGFSLIRKVLEHSGEDLSSRLGNRSLGEVLLEPTRIYVSSIRNLLDQHRLNAMAHITGGGLIENLPRVIPCGLRAVISASAWQRPPVFDWLQETGNIDSKEMFRTFNCGIGMVLCVPESEAENVVAALQGSGEEVYRIGNVAKCPEGSAKIVIEG